MDYSCNNVICGMLVLVFGLSNAFTNFGDVECGKNSLVLSRRTAKIIGGQNAEKAEFPWLVSLTRRGSHFCGGSLITKRHVMTAAHCLCTGSENDLLKPNTIKITISQHDITQKTSEAYQMSIKTIRIHPNYVCTHIANDIAILELDKEVEWTNSVAPACLPAEKTGRNTRLDNRLATVAGWGWTHEDSTKGQKAEVLQKAKVNIIPIDTCKVWYKSQGKNTEIQESQICAGHEQGGIDSCWTDSGGPLMVEDMDQMLVVGVVSTGVGCGRPFLPGLYTRISRYLPWIREVLAQD